MNWEVRDASNDDVDRLALIGSSTFLETFAGLLDGSAIVAHCHLAHSSETYLRYLQSGATAWLAETSDGQAPIGFGLLAKAEVPGSAADGSDVELKRIYVLSRFHGDGLGAAIMQRAIEEAKRRQSRRLLLGVYAGNSRARAFYARKGFIQIANRQFRVGSRQYDDVVLAKTIV